MIPTLANNLLFIGVMAITAFALMIWIRFRIDEYRGGQAKIGEIFREINELKAAFSNLKESFYDHIKGHHS